MKLITDLSFPSLFFHHWDQNGHEMGVMIVKGSFHIDEGKRSNRVLTSQPEILLSDSFYGEINASALRQESELAPFKPKTDVSFNAIARSPEAKPLESWPIQFNIKERRSYGFHVFGERFWEVSEADKDGHWQLSPIKPMIELPLTYAHAYGGTAKTSESEVVAHPYNPIGRGLLNDYLLSLREPIAAPQIGLVGEFAAIRPNEPMTVCGCGPLTKSWLPRLSLAGTFDEAWRNERHPRMPVDYDYSYWNGAPLPLQVSPYLLGNEIIELSGVRHEPQAYTFGLPGMAVRCRIVRESVNEPENLALNLDTIHCDISHPDQEHHWMSLTWRLTLPNPDDMREIEIFAYQLEESTV